MTITIPDWLLWIGGGLGVLVLLALAIVGGVLLWHLKDFRFR